MLEMIMRDNRVSLYTIGDFAGFVEHVAPMIHRARSWHLVQVSDGLHAGDVRLLKQMQIDIYRPLMRSMKLVPRKRLSHSQRRQSIRPLREKIEPFFPGYAFLTLQYSDERWREVFKMTGIRGLVCANHQPVEVPLQMIEELRAREIDGAVPSVTKLVELPYIVGQRVRVTDGPFASFPGTVERLPTISETDLGDITLEELDDSHRVHLLVDIFGRSTAISLPLSQIEKV